jgi:hypothetical protein
MERKPYVGIEVIDSYGDRLLVDLTGMLVNDGMICMHNYVTPCAHCGLPVLDSSFEAGSDCCDRCTIGHKRMAVVDRLLRVNTLPEDMGSDATRIIRIMDNCTATDDSKCGCCDIYDLCTLRRCGTYNCVKETAMIDMTDRKLDIAERIAYAKDKAHDAFWDEIVKVFPENVDGAFLMSDMDDIMLSWIRHWVDLNVPKYQTYRGEPLKELHLNCHEWHLLHTGGGCMVAITDNMEVNGKHFFIGVNGELVCIYEDRFDDHFMEEHVRAWEFGDNPCVLMNYFDEIFGYTPDFNACKLFDDCMTIGKSTAV